MKYRIFFILATLFITSINVCSKPQKTVSKSDDVLRNIESLCVEAETVIHSLRKEVKQGNPKLAIANLLHITNKAIDQINKLKDSPQKKTYLQIFTGQRDTGSLLLKHSKTY